MLRVVRIKSYERGLLFRHGDFVRLLEPGKYWFWSPLLRRRPWDVQIASTLKTRFEHELLDVLVRHADLARALTVVELADHQRALVWRDGRLACMLGPGRYAFWKEPYALAIEVFDSNQLRFEHEKLRAITAFPGAAQYLHVVDVADYEAALLLKDGQIVDRLAPGRHVFWAQNGRVTHKTVDCREQMLDVAGQEIMTGDKVTLRLNLLVTYQVVDARKALTVVENHAQSLYREAQLALRAAVGTRMLDALLADKDSIGREVGGVITARAAEFGVAVKSVGLKDIILPGEMKTILNQVVEAEKAAQANLIKRREETAAARSQANTARLLAESPILARMKELEFVQEILAGSKVSVVLGEGDLVGQLRRLFRGDEQDGAPAK